MLEGEFIRIIDVRKKNQEIRTNLMSKIDICENKKQHHIYPLRVVTISNL